MQQTQTQHPKGLELLGFICVVRQQKIGKQEIQAVTSCLRIKYYSSSEVTTAYLAPLTWMDKYQIADIIKFYKKIYGCG